MPNDTFGEEGGCTDAETARVAGKVVLGADGRQAVSKKSDFGLQYWPCFCTPLLNEIPV